MYQAYQFSPVAVMYHSINGLVIKARSEKDDSINEFSAAAATGTLYRLFCEYAFLAFP